MAEKVTALCSLCDREVSTTWEALQASHKCPYCNHGDLNIISGEYSGVAEALYKAARLLESVPPEDRPRLARPVTDLLPRKRGG